MSHESLRAPRSPRGRRIAILILASTSGVLPGCVANSSNPEVHIAEAIASSDAARFELEVSNPGGRNLRVQKLTCQVSQGEASFPVASPEWKGELDLPAKGKAHLTLLAPFDSPSPEADSKLFHLNGELFFADRTGYLGLKSMDLTHTSFQGEVHAKEGKP